MRVWVVLREPEFSKHQKTEADELAFHGWLEDSDLFFRGSQGQVPLRVTHASHPLPKVFSPSKQTLIVHDQLRARLEAVPGLDFLPVEFRRLVEFDPSVFRSRPKDLWRRFKSSPLDRSKRPEDLAYSQVLGDDYAALTEASDANAFQSIALDFDVFPEAYNEPLHLDRAFFAKSAMLIGWYHLVLRDDAYSVLQRELDGDYYQARAVELG